MKRISFKIEKREDHPDIILYIQSHRILVLNALDGTISTANRKLSRKISKPRVRNLLVISVCAVFLLPAIGYPIFTIWECDYSKPVPPYCVCWDFSFQYDYYRKYTSYVQILSIFKLVFESFLPFILLVILNLISSIILVKAKKRLKVKNTSKLKRFTAITIGLNIVFLIFRVPNAIFDIIDRFYDVNSYPDWLLKFLNNGIHYPLIMFFEILKFLFSIFAFIFNIVFNKIYRDTSIVIFKKIFCIKELK